jgi:hypothetical protein
MRVRGLVLLALAAVAQVACGYYLPGVAARNYKVRAAPPSRACP